MLAGIGAGGAGGGTGVVITPAVSWTSIYGFGSGSTNNQTIAGISTGITISASLTGTGELSYSLNGSPFLYTGAFTCHLNDVLSWQIQPPGGTRVSGTITVVNVSNGSAIIGSISYSVGSSPY